jgi:tripartite-type tricarboxylate transporter receptor subunit TctC
MLHKKLAAMTVAAALAVAVANAAAAADFPARPIRMIVPFAVGGTTDLIARALGPGMSERLRQPIVFDNRPGAASLIGVQAVAQAEPDGHTIGLVSNAITIQPAINKGWNVDALTQLSPIGQVATIPLFVVVNPKVLPVADLRGLIAHAKANPGKLNYATTGGADLLTIELFRKMAEVNIVIVPYKGDAATSQAVLAGEAQIFTGQVGNTAQHIPSGALRPLAVTGSRRSDKFPDIPTVSEAGVPGFDSTVWFGIVAPAGTPAAVVNRLSAVLLEVLNLPATRSGYVGTCCSIVTNRPDEFAQVVRSELGRYRKVAADAGIQPQ